ncbi:hypothetical protein AAG906_031353 [Vitis piasezkii]
MFVAEAVGSSFLGVLIDKLIAFPLLEYARRKKVDTTLEEWRRTLTHIEAVLHDAENKQIREKAVKVWLDDLKSLAYDIEDVVDEFDTEAKQRSLTEGSQASTSKVRKLIPTFGALDPRAILINLRHLKIDGTKLERMPMEMSRMKNLQTLTTFVVGKHTGSRVGELRDLSHLSGTLAIFKLQNVADAGDALESNMKGKECLDKLELNWEDDNAIAGDSHDAASVLEKLQPHDNLKELSIGCYYGAKFPSWLGDPSFINMVSLQLSNCKIVHPCHRLDNYGLSEPLHCEE